MSPLGFKELKSTTGAGVAEKILASLENYGIDLRKMRGQAYDVCAAMKGDINGAQAIILRKFPKALYMHCSSNTLYLVVCHGENVPEISNCIGTIKEVTNFVKGSAKRMTLFKKIATCVSGSARKTLLGLRETRLVEHHEAAVQFVEMIPAMLEIFEDMSLWNGTAASSNASQLLSAVTDQCILIAVSICARFSSLLLPLPKSLQKQTIDRTECTSQMTDVIAILNRC